MLATTIRHSADEGSLMCPPHRDKRGNPHVPMQGRYWLIACIGLYAALYLVFYPPIYTSVDESANFGMASLLRHGILLPGQAGQALSMSVPGPHGPVFRFPIGFPAVLALVSVVGAWAFYLVNPVLHMAATWAFAKILRAMGVPEKLAVLYLLYPGFVLYQRTLFSDGFAASLTTLSLYFLVRGPVRETVAAGACLGLALLSRSTSWMVALVVGAGVLAAAWRFRRSDMTWKGRAGWFFMGMAPFLILNGLYNAYTLGSPFRSAYSLDTLSLENLWKFGPTMALSLLLIYPGMLLAPLFYRGPYWRGGLVATTAVVLIACAYNEPTYGNTRLETLVSVTRQILPVMPFYLLAFCGLLGPLMLKPWVRRFRVWEAVTGLLLLMTVAISAIHQRHLRVLVAVRDEIRQTLPAHSIVYGNKDVFKLHQPTWDAMTFRELPGVSASQVAADLKREPTFVVLYLRSRGFADENAINQAVLNEMQTRFILQPGPPSRSGLLHFYRVVGLTPHS